jgi:AraC-like DNA-binding protein
MELRGDIVLTRRIAASTESRGVRCAFFSEFSPDNMRAVGLAGSLRPLAVWIAGVDDISPEFKEGVVRLAGHRVVMDTLDLLRPAVDALPWRLASAVYTIFDVPERFFDASDVGRASSMSRRSVDRLLAESGFATASRIVVGAKLLHAAARLQSGGARVSDVSRRLGYSSYEVLARQCVRVLGCRPTELADVPPRRVGTQIASFIYARLCAHDGVIGNEAGFVAARLSA